MNADMSVFMAPHATWIQQAHTQIKDQTKVDQCPITQEPGGLVFGGLNG